MTAFFHTTFGFVTAWGALRLMLAVVSITIWSKEVNISLAASADVPSADKLERITEFFNNEIAAGNLPGAVVLIEQHGKPVY